MLFKVKFYYLGKFIDEIEVAASNSDRAQEMATDLLEDRIHREVVVEDKKNDVRS